MAMAANARRAAQCTAIAIGMLAGSLTVCGRGEEAAWRQPAQVAARGGTSVSRPAHPEATAVQPATYLAAAPANAPEEPDAWIAPAPRDSASAAPAPVKPTSRGAIAIEPPSQALSSETSRPAKSSSLGSTLSMLGSLAIVLGLFLGAAWLLRRTAPSAGPTLPRDVVEVLGRTPLAPRQQLYLLRFGRRLLLVSHQLGQTTTLGHIDDPTEVDHLLGLCEQASPKSLSQSFQSVLQHVSLGRTRDA